MQSTLITMKSGNVQTSTCLFVVLSLFMCLDMSHCQETSWSSSSSSQDPEWIPSPDHSTYVLLAADPMTWNDANAYCRGLSPVTLDSQTLDTSLWLPSSMEESSSVLSLFDGSVPENVWINCYAYNGSSVFRCGAERTAPNFSNWAAGQPGNLTNVVHGVQMTVRSLLWYAAPSNSTLLSVICQAYSEPQDLNITTPGITILPNTTAGWNISTTTAAASTSFSDSTTVIPDFPTTTDRAERVDDVIIPMCEEDVYILPSNHILKFNSTKIFQVQNASFTCSVNLTEASVRVASRNCTLNDLGQAVWLEPVLTAPCRVAQSPNQVIDNLAEVNLTKTNIRQVAGIVANTTTNLVDEEDGKVIGKISLALKSVVAALSSEELPAEIVEEVSESVIGAVDNILNIPDIAFDSTGAGPGDGASASLLSTVDTLLTAVQRSSTNNFTFSGDNIVVAAVKVDEQSFPISATIKPSAHGSNDAIDFAANKDTPSEAEGVTTLSLPRSVIKGVAGRNRSIPVSVYLMTRAQLFQSNSSDADGSKESLSSSSFVGSPVLSVTVEGAVIENLPIGDEIAFTFPINKSFQASQDISSGGDSREDVTTATCSFWSEMDGGTWSDRGCRTGQLSLQDGSVSCWCNHLTSFAVLLDVQGGVTSKALDMLSVIGCSISIICLVVTLCLLLGIRTLRKKLPSKILVNLASSLLGLYLAFVIGIDRPSWGGGCTAVAILLHFFCLASITWMGVEAFNMYLMFVRVMNAYTPRLLLKCCLVGWGVPSGIVIITAAVRWRDYANTEYCFLVPGQAFYFGLLLPVAVILAFNVVIYILVVYKLTCGRKMVSQARTAFNKETKGGLSREEVMRRAQNAIAIGTLLGVTWLFGFLAIGQGRLLFSALFTIFNSLQGVFIFALFGLRQPDVRRSLDDMRRRALGASARRKSSSAMLVSLSGMRKGSRPSEVTPMTGSPRPSVCAQNVHVEQHTRLVASDQSEGNLESSQMDV